MRWWMSAPTHARPMAELTYEVSFKGVASPTLRAAFGAREVTTGVGTTSVRCTHDALREVIARIEDFRLELIGVRLIAGGADDHAAG